MMKMKKKLLAVLMTALMFGMCGCQNEAGNVPSAADTATTAAENVPSAVEAEDKTEPIELVNLRGDVISAVRHSDGSCTDADGNVYRFDGVDIWTDANGAEWNETVQ